MSEDDVREYIDKMKKFTENVTISSSTSQQFLEKVGICTPDGKLKSPYSQKK